MPLNFHSLSENTRLRRPGWLYGCVRAIAEESETTLAVEHGQCHEPRWWISQRWWSTRGEYLSTIRLLSKPRCRCRRISPAEIQNDFYCSTTGELEPLSDPTKMYPMDEFGAIYTSGLTFFRQSHRIRVMFTWRDHWRTSVRWRWLPIAILNWIETISQQSTRLARERRSRISSSLVITTNTTVSFSPHSAAVPFGIHLVMSPNSLRPSSSNTPASSKRSSSLSSMITTPAVESILTAISNRSPKSWMDKLPFHSHWWPNRIWSSARHRRSIRRKYGGRCSNLRFNAVQIRSEMPWRS